MHCSALVYARLDKTYQQLTFRLSHAFGVCPYRNTCTVMSHHIDVKVGMLGVTRVLSKLYLGYLRI